MCAWIFTQSHTHTHTHTHMTGNEVEIGNLPEKEFRIMIVKKIQDLRKPMEKMQEMFAKDLEELKNK